MRKFLRLLAIIAFCLAPFVAVAFWLLSGTSGPHPPELRIKADFQSLGSAIKTYKINAGNYPSTEQGLKALVECPTIPPLPDDWVQIWDKIPTDPWRREYQYRLVGEAPHDRFELRSLGKDGIEGTNDDQSSLAP